MSNQTQDPRFEQTILIDEPQKRKGRPEYGRKIVGGEGKVWADDQRKSRSVWSTSTENELLKQIMEIIKYDNAYENITLGEIVADFLKNHPGSKLENGNINPNYLQGKYPSAK